MNRKTGILMHKLVCLSNLQLECLDELKVTAPRMLELKNNLTEFAELLNEELRTSDTVMKTTYFQDISNKIDSILRHNFNPKM